jgi:putative hemolysin
VHADYRGGAVITLLWSGLADYLRTRDYDYLMGCASIGMGDGGHMAASVYLQLAETRLAPPEWRVFPHHPLALTHLDGSLKVSTPALIKGYLRVGAFVCGEPAWDADFNTADLMLLLSVKEMNQLYARHFMNK